MVTFTVKDLLKLETMKNFQVVAGEKGMDRPIKSAEILDFEFTQGAQMGRESIFDGESVVLTSLLFAKGHPELILDAVKQLKEFNVSAMAYKAAFFDPLPEEVIAFANKENFPILRFGGDEFFEQIIFEIMFSLHHGDEESKNSVNLMKLLDEGLESGEVRRIAHDINPDFRKYAMAVSVGRMKGDITQEVIFSQVAERIKEKTAMIKHDRGFMLILTQDEPDGNKFRALLEDLYVAYDLMRGNVTAGISSIGSCWDELDRLVREAVGSRIVAEIEGKREIHYPNMGIYQIIADSSNQSVLKAFAKTRMDQIFQLDKDNGDEFYRTALAYVKEGGDIAKTAEATFCHKNTVRYRLGKIQKAMNLSQRDKDFYLELSFAIKSHLFYTH